ncbi:unnamed protein product [Schistosoma rodhaini]|uniref:Cation-transporting ATPase n=1 Tax=Schistosoma rodhaini TaxID=6188 RepID=A0AA85FFN3_9TREM|nr:unnamed protein product [Schistosoma rodhaini]
MHTPIEKTKDWTKEDQRQEINELDDTVVDVTGYSSSYIRTIFMYIGIILTCGLLRLVFHWFPHWMLMCMNKECALIKAEKILVKDVHGVCYIHDVVVEIVETANCNKHSYVQKSASFMLSQMKCFENDGKMVCYFVHKCLKHVWDSKINRFELPRGWHETAYEEILDSKPLNNETVLMNRALYGTNEISINLTSIIRLLLDECLHPFYCFQIFSCILWYFDEYWMYATCIVVISIMSLSWQIYELRRNEKTPEKFNDDDIPYEVGVLRQFPFSSSLQRMSVITRALNQNHFNIYTKGAPETIELLCRCDTIPRDFHSTLSVYTREGYRVLALAWKPLKAAYTKVLHVCRERLEQNLRFLGLLIMENRLKPETTQVIKNLGYANIRPVMVTGDNMLTALSVARDCEMIDELDRIILVSAKPPPPLLPHAQSSSPNDSVTCSTKVDLASDQQQIDTSSNHVSLPSILLTQSQGTRNNNRPRTHPSFNATNSLFEENFFNQQYDSLVEFHYAEDLHKPVTEVTATTETGTTRKFHKSRPVDRTSTKTDADAHTFSVRNVTKSRKLMHRLCEDVPCVSCGCEQHSSPSSSPLTDITAVPNVSVNGHPRTSSDQREHHDYEIGKSGCYLKDDLHSVSNHRLNRTRPVSIRMLDRPDFHLAISGKTWAIIREYYPWLIPKLVVKGTVFARFRPEQKAQLIESLQSVGYFVSMCGDGANDCGALKVAHAGIALSEAEASVASPFTSKQQNISCVPTLIREGRCALTTSFGAFKFMVGYSMIQFFSVILLYYIGSNISDLQYTFIDFFVITSLGLTFGYTPAYPRLSVEPPGMRLVSTVTLLSLGLQLLTCGVVQFSVFVFTRLQPWYLPLFTYHEDYELKNYESTAVFSVSVYQYIILAIVFSKSAPYRRSILSNHLFVVNLIACIAGSLYLTSHPARVIRKLFELCRFPSVYFVIILHGIVLGNLLFGYILESIVDGVSFRQRIRHIQHALFPRHVSRKDYEHIRDEIDRLAGVWPPIIRSASVQALPRELFNECDVVGQIAQTSRKRYNSRLSTDSESDEDFISVVSVEKAVQLHYNSQSPSCVFDTVPKSAIEKSVNKKRTSSTSSYNRHSFNTTRSLESKSIKRNTFKENTPKQQTPVAHQTLEVGVLTPTRRAERIRSQSGPKPLSPNSVDLQSDPFQSATYY